MASRAPSVGSDDDALFVKDGIPVKFCFHRSVKQGRGRITRDVERHGGEIVPKERRADVLLVDEEADIAFFRKKYYSSTELYRHSLYVEKRGFVQHCIRTGSYVHVGPIKRGMPGRAPGGGGRKRVEFTEDDRNHLAYYLATLFPTRDGRMGNSAYKDLERLGRTKDRAWAWTRRHTFHSWREHYKINSALMDVKIDFYLNKLKNVGHHMGHDPRRHDYRELRQEEEEETDDEEEQERQGIRRQNSGRREPQQVLPRVAAREAQETFDEEEEEDIQEPRRAKRHRVHSDAHLQRGVREAQAKRPRVLEASSNEGRSPGVEARRESTSERENESDGEMSQEIEGSDLFGDRMYGDGSPPESDNSLVIMSPTPLSPKASPVRGLPSTQATLVASPPTTHKGKQSAPDYMSTRVVDVQALAPEQNAPRSPEATLVTTREHTVVQRARVRGASAQPGPSVPQEVRKRGGVATVQGVYRSTRARSRSVEPQHRPGTEAQLREDKSGRGKGKAREEVLVSIEEDVQIAEGPGQGEAQTYEPVVVTGGLSTRETFEDEMAVEGLLQANVDADEDGESDRSIGGREGDDEISDVDDDEDMPELPRFQDIEIESDPTDSDDAETHASLVRGAVREDSVGEGGIHATSEQRPDQDALESKSKPQTIEDQEHEEVSDSDDAEADRIEHLASRSLHATPSPPLEHRVTRSRTAKQTQIQTHTEISPSRTRSGRTRVR